MKSKYCKVNFQKARDACTITCLRSKPCKGWQPESDQEAGLQIPWASSTPVFAPMHVAVSICLHSSWPSSTALVSRGLTLLLSFSFRNPRERLWLAQLGPDTCPLTNQLWPERHDHMRYAASHWATGAASRTAPKGEGCGAHHKVVADCATRQ